MKKLLAFAFAVLSMLAAVGAAPTLTLTGRVKEAAFKSDLTHAYVLLYDSAGAVRDSIRCDGGLMYRGKNEIDTLSTFSFQVPRVDSTYVFDVVCEGYNPQTVTYTVAKPGSREVRREMPTVFLTRAPRQLKELTVTASKIKFYNKGDTIVYNADAFQLAEGSMLDALISQLPGAELNDNGQIKVNGEFVESLLLNGKEFMDGNNNVMLENIAAYTVKDVQVYEGQTPEAKRRNDALAPKVLTMDVRLKREYNMGWILNAQGGYGTDDRYMGRLYAQWFNATTRVSLVGNVNNLNDNRKPGKNDTWTPEQMPSGTKESRMAAIDYFYESPEGTRNFMGNAAFEQTIANTRRTSSRTNFLPGGDTYDYAFGRDRLNELRLSTGHGFYLSQKGLGFGTAIDGKYSRTKNTGSDLSATFGSEQQGITAEVLEALYSTGSPEQLDAVVNRSATRTDGWHRQLQGRIQPYMYYTLPGSGDNVAVDLSASYTADKQYGWHDYDINYGADPAPAVRRRQYTDDTPNHTLDLSAALSYRIMLGENFLALRYRFAYQDWVRDSYMYALDRLADMGVYGVVPAEYLDAFDAANSYTSRLFTGRHSLTPTFMYSKRSDGGNYLMLHLAPEVSYVHRRLNYWRNGRDYRLSRDNVSVAMTSIWDAMVEYYFGLKGEGRQAKHRNSLRYSYRVDRTLPDMVDMLDITDDADPLNIYYGNPDLKTATRHRHLARWSYSPHSRSLNNILYLGYTHTSGALTRGYTYDTSTGVRYNRMYNVAGNRTAAVTNELSLQFGSTKQFTLSSETDLSMSRYADMVGVDMDAPALTKVNNRNISEKLKLGWQFAGQSLQLRGDFMHRHTTSTQPGFADIDAWHANYGISGVFKLPAGFGISTDFMCYTRRGYGSAQLDTTDPVWNARLTYTHPRHTRWVFTLDGFDLLQQLSNVNYAVTATGRTVSYTNTIPRYVLLSIQYRLNIQPKKR